MAAVSLQEIPIIDRRGPAAQGSPAPSILSLSSCRACLSAKTPAKRPSLRTSAAAGLARAPQVPRQIPADNVLSQPLGRLPVEDAQGLGADDASAAAELDFNVLAQARHEPGSTNIGSGGMGLNLLNGASEEVRPHWDGGHRNTYNIEELKELDGFRGVTPRSSTFHLSPVGDGEVSAATETTLGPGEAKAAPLKSSRVGLQDRLAFEQQRAKEQGRASRDRRHTAMARALTFCLRGAQSVADVAHAVQGSEHLMSLGAVSSCLSKLGQEGHTSAVIALLQWMRQQGDSSAAGEDGAQGGSVSQGQVSLLPNTFTCNAALGALRANREWDAMDRVLKWMQLDRIPLDTVTLNTYLAAYLDRGMDDVAWGVLARTAEHLHPRPDLFSVRTMAHAAVLQRKGRGDARGRTVDENLSVLWGRLGLLLDLYREAAPQLWEGEGQGTRASGKEGPFGTFSSKRAGGGSEGQGRAQRRTRAEHRQQQQLPEIEALLRSSCTQALRGAVEFAQGQHSQSPGRQLPADNAGAAPEPEPSSIPPSGSTCDGVAVFEEQTGEDSELRNEQDLCSSEQPPSLEEVWAKRALDLAERMRVAGVRFNGSTYYWAIRALCLDPQEHQFQIRVWHREMRDRRYLPDVALCNSIITALGGARRWWAALEILEEMRANGPRPTAETEALVRSQFNFLLNAGRKRRLWKWSLQLLQRMQAAGVTPDAVSWRTALVTCAMANETGAAVRVFQEMVGAGHQAGTVAYGALLSALEKGQQWAQAEEVWAHMRKVGGCVNVQAYTTMISALGKQGQYGRAVSLFNEMLTEGISADTPAYNALISACAYTGDGERALEWLRKMEAAGVSPNSTSFEQVELALQNQGHMDGVDGAEQRPSPFWQSF